jgi:tripartite-type tricarboxylate transporter receptor subunit TctC
MRRSISALIIVVSFLGLTFNFNASAEEPTQAYPSRTIKIIQPLGPGSPGDIVSRAIAKSLGEVFKQAIIVENKVGANGIIGMDACAKALPDGYTICVPSFSQITTNPVLYAKLPYDPSRDLAPVILIGDINSSFVVNEAVPVNSVRELAELGKAQPGKLNWGSWGIGSFPHLYMAWLQSVTGASFIHVPYKTIGQAVQGLVSDEVQVLLNTPGIMGPLAKAGKVKILAVVARHRSPLLPDVPTLEEAGFELPLTSWVGVTVPTGTPKQIIQRLNSEIGKLLADPKFVARILTPMSISPIGGSPDDFSAVMKRDRAITEKVAKAANIKAE